MSGDVLIIVVAIAAYWGLKWFFGERKANMKVMPNKIFFWIITVTSIILLFTMDYWGTKIPGSIFERNEYKAMIYINLFPGEQRVKSYRVPAMISAEDHTTASGNQNGGVEYEGGREYIIEYAVMPNGGKITFHSEDNSLELNTVVSMHEDDDDDDVDDDDVDDDDEHEWGIELTNVPVKSSK